MENPAEYGAELYKSRGCAQCHSLDGSKKVGPSFLGLWGDENHQVRVGGESGPVETVAVDENYILESIWEPGAKVVVGYGNKMPAFKGQLSEDDVNALIAYLKTLKK